MTTTTLTRLQSERRALLDDVLADPADDVARLIFADWLDDGGEHDRAEFIRCQVAVAVWSTSPGEVVRYAGGEACGADAGALLARSQTLLRQGYFAWSPFDSEFHKRHHQAIGYSRGFVWSVRCPLAEWLEHGKAIVRTHPVTRVVATDREPELRSDGVTFAWYAYGNMHGGDEYQQWTDEMDAIPTCIACLIRPEKPYGYIRFASPDAANDAISTALLQFAHGG